MKSIKFEKRTVFYFLFFIILSFAKGIGLDNNDLFFNTLTVFSVILLFIHIFNEKYSVREILFIAIFTILGIVILIASKKTTILISIVSIILAKNINYEKLFKAVFVVRLLGFISVISLSLMGLVENVKSYRLLETGDIITRYSLGFQHANITYLNFLVLVILYIYINYEKLRGRQYIFILILSWILYAVTDSRTGFLVLLITILINILSKKKKLINNFFVRKGIILMPIICSFFILSTSIFYSTSNKLLYELNSVLTGRLELSSRFLKMYNIKLFGQTIIEGSNVNGSYLRIDSGYISLLLGYGFIIFIIFIIAQISILKRYINSGNNREIALIISFLIYGITEVYIYNIFINISLIFLSDLLYKKESYYKLKSN